MVKKKGGNALLHSRWMIPDQTDIFCRDPRSEHRSNGPPHLGGTCLLQPTNFLPAKSPSWPSTASHLLRFTRVCFLLAADCVLHGSLLWHGAPTKPNPPQIMDLPNQQHKETTKRKRTGDDSDKNATPAKRAKERGRDTSARTMASQANVTKSDMDMDSSSSVVSSPIHRTAQDENEDSDLVIKNVVDGIYTAWPNEAGVSRLTLVAVCT